MQSATSGDYFFKVIWKIESRCPISEETLNKTTAYLNKLITWMEFGFHYKKNQSILIQYNNNDVAHIANIG